MKFTKMHGIGNDYVYVNCFEETVDNPSEVAKYVSDRHFGIGSDGLILIKPSDVADFEMEMYNADGSRGEMCGNGIRCVAKYVYDYGLTDKEELDICSMGAIKHILLNVQAGKVATVQVDMGEPIIKGEFIPTASTLDKVVDYPIDVMGEEYRITCVSMGNPHAIIYINDTEKLDIDRIGPRIENHAFFPNRTNTEFVQNIDRKHIRMRVWERGTGETLACGTGCCALTVAGVLNGLTDREVDIDVLGGRIHVRWDETDNHVYMTGPAVTVFDGEIEI